METVEKSIDDAALAWKLQVARAGVSRFQPRIDRPELFDQQTGFLNSDAYVSVCLGGNRSGKTETAAQKLARLVLWKQPPPWQESPFLIISDTLDQVCEICWKEKLRKIIPENQIEWNRISWHDQKRQFPATVPLRPWPRYPSKRWVLEFRAIGQERRTFQGRRYGGAWFTEQCPYPVIEETLRGLTEIPFGGAVFLEFTPVDPDLCLAIEEKIEAYQNGDLPDWAFFRMNSECNDATPELERGIKRFLANVSEGLLETRRTGALPIFAGIAYPEFNPAVHVLDNNRWREITGHEYGDFPENVRHRRGIDWGESAGHPFTCVWGYKDGSGRWFIYDAVSVYGDMRYEEIQTAVRERWPWPQSNLRAEWGISYADRSRPERIMEFSAAGIPCQPARNDQLEGVESVRRLLRVNETTGLPALFIHASCKNLIQQMRTVRWVKSAAELAIERGTRMPMNPQAPRYTLLKWKDDEADGLRYMIFSEDSLGDRGEFTSQASGFDPQKYGIQQGGRETQRPVQRLGLQRWSRGSR